MVKSQLKWGSVLSYVQMAANIVINLAFTPIMLHLLGDSEYGLYNTVASTISMLSILNLGFNSSYIRYYSKYRSRNDEHAISRLNGLFLTIFSVIGIVAFLCGLFLSFNLDIIFKDGLTSAEYEIAQVLMLMLSFNLAVSFPSSVFKSIISAHERFVFLKIVNMIRTLCGPMVSIPILLMGGRSIAMVSALVVFYLIADFLHIYYSFKKLKIKISFGKLEAGLFKDLLVYTSFIAMNLIVDQVNWNLGKVILGRYRGTAAVSIYSIGYTLSTSYNMFSTSVSGVFAPRIHKITNTTDLLGRKNALTSLFIKVGRVQFLILGLVASGLVFFGRQFITCFWVGSAYVDSYYVALLLILPATIPLIQNIGIEIQRSLNKHHFRSVVYLFMAAVNIAISITLSQKYGAVGSAVGTACALTIANGVIMNIYYHKKCDINIIAFWKEILCMLKGLLLPVALGVGMQYVFDTHTIWGFLAGVLCYSIAYCASMWFFAMNDYEKALVLAPVKKILRKTKK